CGVAHSLTLAVPTAVVWRPSSTAAPLFFPSRLPPPPSPTLFPYTTLFRSLDASRARRAAGARRARRPGLGQERRSRSLARARTRSEEHTSELQSRFDLVCRLLLEKKQHQLSCPPRHAA